MLAGLGVCACGGVVDGVPERWDSDVGDADVWDADVGGADVWDSKVRVPKT